MNNLINIISVAFLLVTAATTLCRAQSVADTKSPIDFAADKVVYDQKYDVITATGNVILIQNGNSLNAETVIYDVKTGEVRASGGITIIEPSGNILNIQDATLNGDLRKDL